MTKFSLEETMNEIKRWLEPQYHHLLDQNVYNISSNFKYKNTLKFKTPYECIKYLSKYFKKVKYYETLLKKSKTIKFPFHYTEYNSDIDQILLEYIKYSSNLVPILIWPAISSTNFLKDEKSDKFIKYLNKNGEIQIVKYLKLTKKQAEGFIFQCYPKSAYFKYYSNLLETLKNKKFSSSNNNLLIMIYWKPKIENKYYFGVGTQNEGKQKLRNLLFEPYRFNLSHVIGNEIYKDRNLLHIVDSEFETLELSQIIFNKNSLDFMNYQRMDLLLGRFRKFAKSVILINLYKKVIHSKLEVIDITRLLTFSSIILFALGLRVANDIDAFFYEYPNLSKSETGGLKKSVENFLSVNLGGKSRQVIELIVKGYGKWNFDEYKDYPHKWYEKDFPKLHGANNYQELIFNPKYHFYFLGIKCGHYSGDLKRRQLRNRPASVSDLIAINKMTMFSLDIPPLPKKIWVSHEEVFMSGEKVDKFLIRTQKYLKYRYSIFKSIEELKKILKI